MQSAPYLEGDNYYTHENSKTIENEIEDNTISSDNNEILNEESLLEQLHKTEEEIVTLRQVLNVKLKLAQDLKRQLGITAINEMKGDIIHSINSIKESNTFKATTGVMKNVKEKTTSTITSASSKFSQKIGMLRNTNTFKSIEGKMGNAYSSVKKIPCNYNPGDKIFAKVKGFVYWPARVNPLPEDIVIPVNKIPIFFYGTHEVFFIAPTSCWPYDEKNKNKWGKPRSRAYFNQGMDEIENYSTIYQYGVDPVAEDFLSQFYEFKKANGQNSTPKKTNAVENKEHDEIEDISKSDKDSKKTSKKRNKSGSSLSSKENKKNKKNSIIELNIQDEKLDIVIEKNEEMVNNSRKRRISDSALSTKENTNDNITPNIDLVNKIAYPVDVSTRKRQKSGESGKSNPITVKTPAQNRKLSRRKSKVVTQKEAKLELKREIVGDCDPEPILELFDSLVVKLESHSVEIAKNAKEEENTTVQSDQDDHLNQCDIKPTTRCRSKSVNTRHSNSQSAASNMASNRSDNDDEDHSDSPSVDSDNPADEDFRPAVMSKRTTKKAKVIKSPIIKSPVVKKISKPRNKTSPIKKKINTKFDCDDSLSSISSIADSNASDKDIKSKITNITTPKIVSPMKIEKEISCKEAIKKLRAQRISDSFLVSKDPVVVDWLTNGIVDSVNINLVDVGESGIKDGPECTLDKEVVVNIYKDDILVEEATNMIDDTSKIKTTNNDIIESDNASVKIIDSNISICELDNSLDSKGETKLSAGNEFSGDKSRKKNKSKRVISLLDSDEEVKEDVKEVNDKTQIDLSVTERIVEPITQNANVDKIKKVKINMKDIKITKSTTKKQKPTGNNRKRNRKLSSSASSAGSDIEIIKHERSELKSKTKRAKLVERNSESDDNTTDSKILDKNSLDKMMILHNFNANIRSSLVLGHEDYETCLQRFRSLCNMDIDLVSLVKVWQLMDTVKKCRRYKRNEKIKQEAQAVYKRFMDIYSNSSKEEIATSQALLMQYRHNNNLQNQNVGMESSNKMNDGSIMPISIAEMFQNKSCQIDCGTNNITNKGRSSDGSMRDNNSNKLSSAAAGTTIISSTITTGNIDKKTEIAQEVVKPVATEEEISDEKIRIFTMDLEAKVTDILNKIEKSSEPHPGNQRSLSHLLPVTDTNTSIKLPTQWRTVNNITNNIDANNRTTAIITTNVNNNDYLTDDDDDDDDVEAIVRRIEEVAIKMNDNNESTHISPMTQLSSISSAALPDNNDLITNDDHIVSNHNNHSSNNNSNHFTNNSSSALDARIENLINNSFISSSSSATQSTSNSASRETRQKKARISSKVHHKSATRPNANRSEISSEPLVTMAPPQSQTQQKANLISSLENNVSSLVNISSYSPSQLPQALVHSSAQSSQQLIDEDKDDIEIYDMLGV